ncbi:MAG: methyltransferase domain-containing protein [Aureliella sp.]
MLFPNLATRSNAIELMDAPDCDKQLLLKTLEQFESINRFITPSRRLIRKHFLPTMQSEPDRSWRFLDIGAGGGDLAQWFAHEAKLQGLKIHITCLDLDPFTSNFARDRCSSYPNIEVVCDDMFEYCPGQKWDFIYSNHVLHHLTWEQLAAAMRLVTEVCERHFALVDLHRNYLSYYGYTLIAAVFLRGSFAYHDGRVSIRKAFRPHELRDVVNQANLDDSVQVTSLLPGHLVLHSR